MSWEPDWSVPPMEVLQEVLAEREITFEAAADALEITPGLLVSMMTGKAQLDSLTAVRLERLTGVRSTLWMGLYEHHDSYLKGQQASALIAANRLVRMNPEYDRPRGALTGAATHSAAFLLTELRNIGWELVQRES